MGGNRIIELDPVGGVEFVVRDMTGRETLGRPFNYDLEILTDVKHLNLNLDQLLGQPMTLKLELPDNRLRHFNGLVDEASFAGLHDQQARFRVTLRPWFWFLSKRSHCRIFQNKSVTDIVKQVFKDNKFTDFADLLTGRYESRDYCVQYRESDFDFVSRLLEDEGIYYYWSHDSDKHTMVLADSLSAHEPAAGYKEIVYRSSGDAQEDQDHISEWTLSQQICTSNFETDSYNFENPSKSLAAKGKGDPRKHALREHTRYDYGALYGDSARGESYAKIRIHELTAMQTVGRAHADARGVSCGALFDLADYPREDQNKQYLIIDAEYFISNSEMETGGGEATASFAVEFASIDANTVFRPARVTSKSVVRGPQTAVVVGKFGEDIWTDKYGRVKVQFHWDNEGKNDQDSSCWLRVAHAWAGKSWGTIAIPRIGQEVIVDFLEGDPDQPIITGSVYNDDNKPPYILPDNQTQSGIKTRSTKGGDTKKYNELRFEDKKGSEEIYFHAERDFKRVVENDDILEVGLETKKKGDQTVTIHNDRTVTLDEGNDKLEIKKGNRSVKVKEGSDKHDVNQNIDIKAGQKINIKASQELSITVGGSKLKMTPAAIELKGVQIKIEGNATLDLKAAMVTLDGSGMAMVKGGLVKIN
jgi:type VI secretion system secreted protein VgrG